MNWITNRNYGFSDAADLFVFISGYTASLVYARMMLDHGFIVGATRLFKRVWQLYVAHIVLFVLYLVSIGSVALYFNNSEIVHEFNAAGLVSHPLEILSRGPAAAVKPLNLDVLPLYIALMAAFPPVLWLMLRKPDLVMLLSLALYLAARWFGWEFAGLSGRSLVFQPVCLAIAVRVWLLVCSRRGSWCSRTDPQIAGFDLPWDRLPPVRPRHDDGEPISRLLKRISEMAVRCIQSEQQDQPRAISLSTLCCARLPRDEGTAKGLAWTEIQNPCARDRMRTAVATCVLRWRASFLCGSFCSHAEFRIIDGPGFGGVGRHHDHDCGRLLRVVVEEAGSGCESAAGRTVRQGSLSSRGDEEIR